MEPEIEYKLTATVNGEQVYTFASALPEVVEQAMLNAEQSVAKETDSLLQEFTVGNKMYE